MKNELYKEMKPCADLEVFVDSFWMHHNPSEDTQINTVSASNFVNLVFFVHKGEIIFYVLTGIWTEPKEIHVHPKTTVYGCRMKILAPEFLLQREVATICNQLLPLDLTYLNVTDFNLNSFDNIVKQWEEQLVNNKSTKIIPEHKLKLSKLLYTKRGNISPPMVYEEIYWANRQINRYLNKYIGIPLKKYLNILKCHDAFIDIIAGDFFPAKNYFDQSHFIREVKKYTGETPKKLFKNENDRFIQLRNITGK